MPDSAQHSSDDDIMVMIGHPWGDLECPLPTWIKHGPGPRRYVRPFRAWSRTTGEELPLTVIPLQYRNTRAARREIREGRLPNPWPDTWTLPSQQEEEHLRQVTVSHDPYEDEL